MSKFDHRGYDRWLTSFDPYNQHPPKFRHFRYEDVEDEIEPEEAADMYTDNHFDEPESDDALEWGGVEVKEPKD